VLALVSNLILITFASQSSHLLSLAFVAVGLVLIWLQKTIQGRSHQPN
jgi:hypothetical protein